MWLRPLDRYIVLVRSPGNHRPDSQAVAVVDDHGALRRLDGAAS